MNATSTQDALQQQRRFFRSGITRDIEFRIRQLELLRSKIQQNEEKILGALQADMKKPKYESYISEVGFIYQEISHTLKNLKSWAEPERVSTPMLHFFGNSEIRPEPLGVVLIIGPWNYPFQLPMAPLIGAIAAGNCCVIKPSEISANTARVISEIFSSGFDPGYIRVIEGGVDVTQQLLAQRWDHIFFTGSTAVGKVVMAAAAKYLTPVTLELGGKSPCIVDRDTDIEISARRITWGKFFNAGQTCVAPDYLLVHRAVQAPLLKQIAKTVEEFYGREPVRSPDYARIINDKHFQRLCKLMSSGKIVFGGETREDERYIAPTLLDEVTLDSPVMQEEIFGPIFPVIEYESIEDAIEIVRKFEKPLALYFFSRDTGVQERILKELSFGGGCINDTMLHLNNFELPFGGVGESGMGAYHGRDSFHTFSHRKSVVKKSFWPDVKLRYPSYGDRLNLIRKVMK